MLVTFLGTGTSVGVPTIGCGCEVCRSIDPRNKRLRSSIYVETASHSWVVDTGPDFREQCLREGIEHLDAVLYSHAHADHIMGFDDLRRFTVGPDENLPVYAAPETMEDLQRVFSYAFSGENRYPGYIKPDPHTIEGPFHLGDTLVDPLPVRHGKVGTIGYLFTPPSGQRLAYISDCKTVEPQSIEKMRGVDILIIDGLRLREHETHMNFEEALAFRQEIDARRTWLTHFSCDVDHEREEAQLPDDVRLAYDGLKIELRERPRCRSEKADTALHNPSAMT